MNTVIEVQKSLSTFSQYYCILFLENWSSVFIPDCLECQGNKHVKMKIQTARTHSFSEHARLLITEIQWTQNPINPPSQNKSYIHAIVDNFSLFVVTVPIISNNAKTAVRTLLHHWNIKFGAPIHIVTDHGSEHINVDMAQLCTPMGIRHSPRILFSR